VLDRVFPDSHLAEEANLLIMPSLDAANIAFNLLRVAAGGGGTVGPILLGAPKSAHILTQTATVRGILNMTALAVVDAAQTGARALPRMAAEGPCPDAGKLGTEHMVSETSDLHRVIVVGGGAGGLELVTRLGNKLGRYKRADVTLIDKYRAHLWKPLLHEIGAGSMDLGVHEIDYLAQAHWHHFRYRIGELIGLDRRARAVHLAAHVDDEGQQVTQPRSFQYDTLVIAIGSQSNDFGTPGVREHALSLDTPLEAKRFHRRLVNAYIRGHAQSTPLRPEQLQVAIIGAGATGTELAAELHYTTRQVVAYGLDRNDSTRDIKINLIEAADRILPALP